MVSFRTNWPISSACALLCLVTCGVGPGLFGCYEFHLPCHRCQTDVDCVGRQRCRKQPGAASGACMSALSGYLCQGFSCHSGASRPCYTGPAGSENQSPCRTGRQFCVENQWEACQNEVTPTPEKCNGIDDDCDGQIDEDVLCVSTIAGGSEGYANGFGRNARFREPRGVALDPGGDLYIADTKNHRIRKLTFRQGVEVEIRVVLWAGTGEAALHDGFRTTSASFREPRGLAVAQNGEVYVADAFNQAIRKIDASDQVTTLAGTSAAACADEKGKALVLREPSGIALAPLGRLWVADTQSHVLRRLDLSTAQGCQVTLVAGDGVCQQDPSQCYRDGPASRAQFWDPSGLAADARGNVYVADYNNNAIRKISPDGEVSTLAGGDSKQPGFKDGLGREARFRFPRGVAVDVQGNVYVADTDNHAIRKIRPDGQVTTLVGDGTPGLQDGDGLTAKFYAPWALAVDALGTLYVADSKNHRIRKITQEARANE